MNQKIRWAVLGSGGIARRRTIPEGIVPARNARLVVVHDINAPANEEIARQFGAHPVDSVGALLAADIDAVYVATPVHLHCDQVIECARAGKHVLCEKPLGLSVAEAEEMIAECRRKEVQLGCAFMMRFQSQHQAALRLIQEGKLGEPVQARAQLSCWYPPIPGAWRQDPALGGGGSLMDMGGHCMDLLEMFFGPVTEVSCLVRNTVHSYGTEDSALALLHFANGALGTVDAFFCVQDHCSQNRLELYGSKGSILARGTISQGSAGEMTAYLAESDSGYDAQQVRVNREGVAIAPAPRNLYQAEIEEFSQALLENRASSIEAAIGLRTQKILAACYTSARSGRVIDVG